MTRLIVPTPPRETVTRPWKRTPELLGASKPRLAVTAGLVLKKQYEPTPHASWEVTFAPTLYAAQPREPPPDEPHVALFGGSYGISFWKKYVRPPLPFQTTLYCW